MIIRKTRALANQFSRAYHYPAAFVYFISVMGKLGRFSPAMFFQLDYIRWKNRGTYLTYSKYIRECRKLCDQKTRDLMNDKYNLYLRCKDLMKRDMIHTGKESPEAVKAFIESHGKLVGKSNYHSRSEGFSVYENTERDPRPVLKGMDKQKQNILEEYIDQHPFVSALYPGAVNTLRIHTANNGSEVRTFIAPKMRLGADGSVTDKQNENGYSYRLILAPDGRVEHALRMDPFSISHCDIHEDTGARLSGIVIPYVPEAISMALEAARRCPENPYVGWDIAIGKDGPVLVEGNPVSGCFNTYQRITKYLYDRGMKSEILEMLAFAGKG